MIKMVVKEVKEVKDKCAIRRHCLNSLPPVNCLLILFTFLLSPFTLSAQSDSLDVKVRVGYNIGGTAPLPMPASIRSIDAFRLTPSFLVGGDVILPLGDRFGLSAGLHLENKGMDADVTVKSYSMEMKKGNSQISGLFTGHVSQQVTQWMLTIPVSFRFQVSSFTFKFGPYFSLLLKKEFSGIASDGYLRQGDPTGPRIEIGNKEGEWATYDFSDEMRSLQWGLGVGLDWRFSRHVGLSADLNWGLSGIFNSDFKTVEQTLYPIYGCIGLFYNL